MRAIAAGTGSTYIGGVRSRLASIALLSLLAVPRWAAANGADLPPEVVLQGFVKPERDHLHLVVRVPLLLLASFGLPKRGPGYLDLANMDERLKQAAGSTGRQIQLQEDGVPLQPDTQKWRISIPSDRSFASYESAVANVDGPPLPDDTDLFWNQGYFDVHLQYPIRSATGHFSIALDVTPELGHRLKLQLQYLPADGPARSLRLPGDAGPIALDPGATDAAWLLARIGFSGAFSFDRFVFLACLVAPFRQLRSLLAVVLVLAALLAATAAVLAQGLAPGSPLLTALSGSALAIATLLAAIGNLGDPALRRRVFLAAVAGTAGGFELCHPLGEAMQFAGSHAAVALASFGAGVALAQAAALLLALAGIQLVAARLLGPPMSLLVLSAVLGHLAWHAMTDEGHELAHQVGHMGLWSASFIGAPWLVPALLAGALAYLLPKGFGGPPMGRAIRF